MGLEAALVALLGSGVIEKGLLVWMILQLNTQNNSISENRRQLDNITHKIQSIETISVELVILKQELAQLKSECGNKKHCHLELEKQKNLESNHSNP